LKARFFFAHIVGRGRGVVGLVYAGHAAQASEGLLDAFGQRGHRLRAADGHALPVRVGQHDVAQKVVERLACDGHAERMGPGEIGLHRLARAVLLGEEDLFVRPVLGAPLLDATLEGTQVSGLVALGVSLEQILEERLGLEIGSVCKPRGDLSPVLFERVRAGTPGPHRLGNFGRDDSLLQILAGGLAVHVRVHGRFGDAAGFLESAHQFPHLGVGHHLSTSIARVNSDAVP
jgi:hypothetical protein